MEEETKPVEAVTVPEAPVQPPKKNFPKIVILLIAILLIGVGGVYAGMQIGKKQVVGELVQKVSPTQIPQPTVIPTPDETANWKTYKNEKYGFEFKYPINYLLNDKFLKLQTDIGYSQINDALSIIKESNKEVGQPPTIYLTLVNTTKSVQKFIDDDHAKEITDWQEWKNQSGLDTVEPKIISTSDGQENLFTYKKLERKRIDTAPNSDVTQYLFKKDGVLFVFSVNYGTYNPDTKENGFEEKQILDQILSTFRFD